MGKESASTGSDGSASDADSARDTARVFRSEELFAGNRVVFIQHAGEKYRLLITRNDRLILQK